MNKFSIFTIFIYIRNTYTYILPKIIKPTPIDQKIFRIIKPATLNYVMVPVVGMVDTFWVSNKGTVQDIAAVGTADQIFFMFFSVMSFLPVILTPKITKNYVIKNKKYIHNIINISIIITLVLSLISSIILLHPNNIVIHFLDKNSIIYYKTIEYLKYRTIGMPFALFNSLTFSIMRGLSDFSTPFKINLITQLFNLIFDPVFIKYFGIKGAAICTVISEGICTFAYIFMLFKKKLLTKTLYNIRSTLFYLIKLGSTIQIRYIFLQLLYIFITKKINNLDSAGSYMASHIIITKFISMSQIIYKGLGITASSVIPSESIYNNASYASNRLLLWMNIIAIFQTILFVFIHKYINLFTNNSIVINITTDLIFVTSLYQYFDGLNTLLEGILQGFNKFTLPSFVSLILYLPTYYIIKQTSTFKQIWNSFTIMLLIKNIIFFSIVNSISNNKNKSMYNK